jgi:hypothetical protein
MSVNEEDFSLFFLVGGKTRDKIRVTIAINPTRQIILKFHPRAMGLRFTKLSGHSFLIEMC